MERHLRTAHPQLGGLVDRLSEALGERLVSVVVYGSSARGDALPGASDLNLLLVLGDLGPETLEAVAPPLRRWLRRGQPMPVLFSPASLREALDVFPIEFLEIAEYRMVVHGDDPLRGLRVEPGDLRLQCERELREKLMRLREGYVAAGGSRRSLRRLLVDSYPSFAAILRGALRLRGVSPPAHLREVVETFCSLTDLDPGAFAAVAALRRGERVPTPLGEVFAAYYGELMKAVEVVDRS